jgi:hypothetical protein
MPTIKSYQEADSYLKGKQERPYAHNTRIQRHGESAIRVLYHGNPIVYFYPNSSSFTSCGWHTMTTKERINWFLPAGFHLYQERSVWYLSKHMDKSYPFADGINITLDGEVSNYGADDSIDQAKKLIKRIKAYVDGYIKALLNLELDQPSGGDCWICLMTDENGKTMGGTDHIESHMDESYYVPSLLMRAYEHNNRLSAMARDGIARLMSKESVSTWQADIVTRDVKSCLTAYLKHELGIPGK